MTQEHKNGMEHEQPKHTPGPWFQHADPEKGFYANVRGSNGRCVADCGSRSDPIAQANARLIAAAPEMLAELQRLVKGNLGHPRGCRVPTLDNARTLIDRITQEG